MCTLVYLTNIFSIREVFKSQIFKRFTRHWHLIPVIGIHFQFWEYRIRAEGESSRCIRFLPSFTKYKKWRNERLIVNRSIGSGPDRWTWGCRFTGTESQAAAQNWIPCLARWIDSSGTLLRHVSEPRDFDFLFFYLSFSRGKFSTCKQNDVAGKRALWSAANETEINFGIFKLSVFRVATIRSG